MRRLVLAWLLLAAACGTDVVGATSPVVYGATDDRVEVFEAPPGPARTVAETAVAMQLPATSLDVSDATDVRITYTATVAEDSVLCPGVHFGDEPDPGECSGTLIDARHVLTAGHCVAAATDCDGVTSPWLFGYYLTAAGTVRHLTGDDVYYCVGKTAFANAGARDYAVVELDRPVVGHAPATVSRAAPAVGTPVTLVGHPDGVTMKIAGGARLRAVTATTLLADVDAFAGNSGSGVLDDSGAIVGILVTGNDDYVAMGSCNVVNVIDPVAAGDGEDLTPVAVAIDAYCATPGVASPACCPGPACADAGVPDAGAPDAGVADAGVADAGLADAGATDADEPDGSAGSDASAPDAGTRAPSSGGCGCRVAGGRAPRGLVAAGLFLVAWLVRRRR